MKGILLLVKKTQLRKQTIVSYSCINNINISFIKLPTFKLLQEFLTSYDKCFGFLSLFDT